MGNPKNVEPICIKMNHEDRVLCVAIWRSGSMIESSSKDKTGFGWNVETNAMILEPILILKPIRRCVKLDI